MCSNTSSRSTTRGGRAGRWIFAKRLAGLTRRVVLSGAEASAQRLSPLLKSRAQRGHKLGTDPLARLEGFEPPTNGFGSHYSIRLSYRRVFKGLFLPRPDVLSSGRWDIPNACWGE